MSTDKSASALQEQTYPANRWLVLIITLSAIFMQIIDTTIANVAMPALQEDLHASFGEVQLVIALYMLAFACVLVPAGRLGDTYGRKRLFMIGMVGFTLASLACGAAPDPLTLIVARVAQGMCSGLMFPQVLAIVQVVFPREERPKALGVYGATIGLATVLGPVTGGGLIDLDIAGSGWRSMFIINIPIGLAALALGWTRIPESRGQTRRHFDIGGTVLVTLGLFLLVLPLVIGRDHDWPVWTLIMLAVSPFVLIAFAGHESWVTKRDAGPLVPTTLFRQRSFTVGLIAVTVFFTGVPSFFFLLMLTLQFGLGYSAVEAGLASLPFAITVAIGSARSAALARKLGVRVLMLGCGLLTLGHLGILATLYWADTDLTGWHFILAFMVAGFGGGLFLAPAAGVILAGIKSADAGSASGLIATAQQVGQAIGVAVAGIFFFALLGSNAAPSSDDVTGKLRSDLAAAGVQAESQQQLITGFEKCFSDRLHSNDPSSADHASCQALQRQAAQLQKPAVAAAINEAAVPEARKIDFIHSMRQIEWWFAGVFLFSLVVVRFLPKVDLSSRHGPLMGGA